MRRVRRFPTNCRCQCLPWSHQKEMAMMWWIRTCMWMTRNGKDTVTMGGIFHQKSPSGWWMNCRDSLLDIHGFFLCEGTCFAWDGFLWIRKFFVLYDTDQCQWSKRQQIPRSNNSGFNLSRSHEILSRRSVVTSRHDVTPQKGGFSIASNRTGKSEAGETYYIIYSLPSPSPSNDTFVDGSSGR